MRHYAEYDQQEGPVRVPAKGRGMVDIRETAILIDHDREEVRVDTNNRGFAGRLIRMGFKEVTRSNSDPYRRFTGGVKQISFRKIKIPSKNPGVFRGKRFQKRRSVVEKGKGPSA